MGGKGSGRHKGSGITSASNYVKNRTQSLKKSLKTSPKSGKEYLKAKKKLKGNSYYK